MTAREQQLRSNYAAFVAGLSPSLGRLWDLLERRSLVVYGAFWRHCRLDVRGGTAVLRVSGEADPSAFVDHLESVGDVVAVETDGALHEEPQAKITVTVDGGTLLLFLYCTVKDVSIDLVCDTLAAQLSATAPPKFMRLRSDDLQQWTYTDDIDEVLREIDEKRVTISPTRFSTEFEFLVNMVSDYSLMDELVELVHVHGWTLNMQGNDMGLLMLFFLSKDMFHRYDPPQVRHIVVTSIRHLLHHAVADFGVELFAAGDAIDLPAFRYVAKHFPADAVELLAGVEPQECHVPPLMEVVAENPATLGIVERHLSLFPVACMRHVQCYEAAAWVAHGLPPREQLGHLPLGIMDQLSFLLAERGDFPAIEVLYGKKFVLNLHKCGCIGGHAPWIAATNDASVEHLLTSNHRRPVYAAFQRFVDGQFDPAAAQRLALVHGRLDVFDHLYRQGHRIDFDRCTLEWTRVDDVLRLHRLYGRRVQASDFEHVVVFEPHRMRELTAFYRRDPWFHAHTCRRVMQYVNEFAPHEMHRLVLFCGLAKVLAFIEDVPLRRTYLQDLWLARTGVGDDLFMQIRPYWW